MACCGTRYYCTAAGPVAVEPDADGWYDVPDGGTSGWYKTAAEAGAVCPYVCEGSCDLTYSPSCTITLEAATGELADASATLPLVILSPEICVIGGTVDILLTTARCSPHAQAFLRFELFVGPTLYQILNVYSARDCSGGGDFLKLVWISAESGYTAAATPSLPLVAHALTKDTPPPCGATFPPARVKLGRVALMNVAGTVTYGEADVYLQ